MTTPNNPTEPKGIDSLRPERYAVSYRDCLEPCAEGDHSWTKEQRDGMKEFALRLMKELAAAEAKVGTPEGIGGETHEWMGCEEVNDRFVATCSCGWTYQHPNYGSTQETFVNHWGDHILIAKNSNPEPPEPLDAYKQLARILTEAGAIPIINGVRIEPLKYRTSEEAELLPLPLQILRLKEINAELCKSFNTLLIDNVNLERKAMTKLDPNALPVTAVLAKSEEGESAADAWERCQDMHRRAAISSDIKVCDASLAAPYVAPKKPSTEEEVGG